jgi:hypothetical protein
MTDPARKNLGSFLGLVMALAYGLVALNINALIFSKIPLHVPFWGRLSMLITIALCGVIFGRLAAWSDNALMSTMVGAAVGALLSILISFFMINLGARNQTGIVRLIFLYFLPRGVILLAPAWLIRWVINVWKNELKTIDFSTIKMALPILPLAFVALMGGLFSIYPNDGQFAINKTFELVESGIKSDSYAQLPPVLLPVDGFLERSKGKYTLQLSDNPDALPIQLPLSSEGNQGYAVLVRFDNGFRFGCAFVESNPEPACGEY